jgi:hypothetical protein
MKQKGRNMFGVVVAALGLLAAGTVQAGSLDPTNAPGPTMHTLEEIYQRVDSLASPQTLSATNPVVNAGYYSATNLTQVDADLAAGNIRANVTIFGVVGTVVTNAGGSANSAGVPKTGQTTTYAAGDDGSYQKGVALPIPRFTVQADTNCVMDNLTGLVWARNANMGGVMAWSNAIIYCETLNYGGQTDWRLPNVRELHSLVDFGEYSPTLPSGHPFGGVQSGFYWSSSSYAYNTGHAWYVGLGFGNVGAGTNATTLYVWPVRGGR